MTQASAQALARAAAASRRVGDVFDAVLDAVEGLGARAAALIRAADRPDRRTVAPLREDAVALIARHAVLVSGSGFVAAPDVLADAPMWLEWWQTTGDSDVPERLVVELDPARPGFYDYTRHGWFTVPRDTGRAHVHGPYVDYYGTDQYILTMSTPVLDGARFLGITGADLFVRRLEGSVLPLMPPGAVLVNAQGRIIVSKSARHVTGALLRGLAPEAVREAGGGEVAEDGERLLARCGRLPFFLVTIP
ncbi:MULTISPECIES: PDC sensor domain-containing protein [Actinomadura]|uniref:Cache domain-containing protein n=1 Tax=Actinomadura miaoliensis TaxID=430685 RepID=A0ABP7W838_9ACTN